MNNDQEIIQNGILPLRLKNIHYYNDRFAGDLIVTTGVIYYLPTRDLDEERRKANHYPGILGFFIRKSIDRAKENKSDNKSYFDGTNLWTPEEGEAAFRKRLDESIAKTRAGERYFENKLPSPMRFEAGGIKNLNLSSSHLYFETIADKHDFKIGSSNMELLSQALQKANFLNDHH